MNRLEQIIYTCCLLQAHMGSGTSHESPIWVRTYCPVWTWTRSRGENRSASGQGTIIEAVFEALKMIDLPLTFQQINDTIPKTELYQFNTPNSIGMICHAVYTHCLTTKERIANGETVIIQVSL